MAIESGVDILAHTTPTDDLWSPSFAHRLVAAHMALTPTLTLWDVESRKGNASPDDIEKGMSRAAEQLEAFFRCRWPGSLRHRRWLHPAVRHFRRIQRGCLAPEWDFQAILASLTTNPAQRFGYATDSGRIAKGMDADLVVLSADPAQETSAFSKVRYTIRGGEVIFDSKK